MEDVVNTQAVNDILAERKSQVLVKGYDADHDDRNFPYKMAEAAVAYAFACFNPNAARHWWPVTWTPYSFKPATPRRNLVKAAALLIAEIERLDRDKIKQEEGLL